MIHVNSYLEKLRNEIVEIDVRSCYDQLSQGGVLIDIREKDEVKSGSPQKATRIPKGLLEMQITQTITEDSENIFLICASGRRSLVAASCLVAMGYKNVFSIEGGFKEWKNQSLPMEVPETLNEEDAERYKRHLLITEVGEQGQLKLLKSKVLVVGAGGIGSPVALYLAAAGIGTIGIIDDDIVDKTNLQRQILHTEKGVNNPKVDSARERLTAINSAITIKTYQKRLTKDNIDEIIEGYDVVLDGTDNFTTRYLINDACVKYGIPNVHGSVFRFEGQVSTFWPAYQEKEAPCYRCLYPSPPPADLAPSCAEAGVLGVLPGTVGLFCATEAIKILVGFGELLVGKLLVYNAADFEFNTYEIEKNTNCSYCNCSEESEYPDYQEYEVSCKL